MNDKYQHAHKQCKRGRPTSFHMQDSQLVFKELGLNSGDAFLDLGCGIGEYSIHAAGLVGESGKVYALDKSPELIRIVKEQAALKCISNIEPILTDITRPLPIQDSVIDICLLATVLHIPDVEAHTDDILREIRRVLKPDGYLVIIECSKKNLSYGPPEDMRLSPEDIEAAISLCGFIKISQIDLGFNYLIKVSKTSY